jgi:hypothetical protein
VKNKRNEIGLLKELGEQYMPITTIIKRRIVVNELAARIIGHELDLFSQVLKTLSDEIKLRLSVCYLERFGGGRGEKDLKDFEGIANYNWKLPEACL